MSSTHKEAHKMKKKKQGIMSGSMTCQPPDLEGRRPMRKRGTLSGSFRFLCYGFVSAYFWQP